MTESSEAFELSNVVEAALARALRVALSATLISASFAPIVLAVEVKR